MAEKIAMVASAITLILLVTDGIALRKRIEKLEKEVDKLKK